MKHARKPDATRQRRYRQRQRRGLAVVAVEADLFRLVDFLIDCGLLAEERVARLRSGAARDWNAADFRYASPQSGGVRC
jgi:hypothetical protein